MSMRNYYMVGLPTQTHNPQLKDWLICNQEFLPLALMIQHLPTRLQLRYALAGGRYKVLWSRPDGPCFFKELLLLHRLLVPACDRQSLTSHPWVGLKKERSPTRSKSARKRWSFVWWWCCIDWELRNKLKKSIYF